MVNYYRILGVEPECNFDEIKRVYRRLVLKFHPDVSEADDAEEKFKEIVEAFKILSDPRAKQEYDKKYRVVSPFPDIIKKAGAAKKIIFKLPKIFSKLALKIKLIYAKDENKSHLDKDFFNIEDALLRGITAEELKDKFYNSDNKYVRMQALKCIVSKDGVGSFKEVEQALKDISKEVKLIGVRAVGYLNIRQLVKKLYHLYKKSGREVRKVIVLSLSAMESSKAKHFIEEACFDEDDDVKKEALKALINIGGIFSESRFRTLLYERDEDIKHLAQRLLNRQAVK
jgi:curved DNA-binding protein CbpA